MKIGFVSLGCPKNLVDAEVMLGLAQQAGHELTADAARRRRARRQHLRVHRLGQAGVDRRDPRDGRSTRRTARCQRLVVTGCLAERYRDELKKEIPEIDAVLGTGEVPEIVGALDRRGRHQGRRSAPSSTSEPFALHANAPSRRTSRPPNLGSAHATCPTYLYDADTPRAARDAAALRLREDRRRLRLQVRLLHHPDAARPLPQPRRPTRSSARRSALAARGVKELLLISQDTTFYGIDRGERGALGAAAARAERVDGLEWIRLLYLYPTTITDDVLDAMAECDKVCKYIDLPLQHASDDVLKRMRRPGHARSLRRAARPDPRRAFPASRCAPPSSSASRARPTTDFAELERLRRGHRLRPRRRLHLLARGRHARARLDDDVPAAVEAAAARTR